MYSTIIRPLSAVAANKGLEITLFSVWHFLYIFLIIGSAIAGAMYLKDKSTQTKQKVLRTLSTLIVVTYLGDFFMHPIVYGELNIDKLPFHICTVLCPTIAFTQFNKKLNFAKETVSALAIVAPLMYITYPGSALGGVSPFSYQVIQTFVYHGLVFAWGFLMVATKQITFQFKNIWKSLVAICLIAVWASIGNGVYNNVLDSHYDWFFLTGSTFPFVPKLLMPLAVISAVFGMVAIIYGIYYGFCHFVLAKEITPTVTAQELAPTTSEEK